MMNDTSSLLSYLSSRRSAKPRNLIAPGPSDSLLAEILTMAARTPDHGKLAPWRFVIVGTDRRDEFAAMLHEAYLAGKPDAGRLELEAVDIFANQAPTLVAVLSSPDGKSKIPLWEQRLSAGAAAMNLIHAIHAYGYAASWITGWAAFDENVAHSLGARDVHDRIAGFIFAGTLPESPDERPRPNVQDVVIRW